MNNQVSNKSYRILVIDDNRAIHEDFRKILCSPSAEATALGKAEAKLFAQPTRVSQSAVFEIDSAYQGEEGLERVRQSLQSGRPYAMATVDVRMPPGWDGIETTQKLWKVDPDLQVVICSAYSDYSWDEIIARLGNSDHLLFLKKPFDAMEILQLANALTEKWRLIGQVRNQMADLEGIVRDRTQQLQVTNDRLLVTNDKLVVEIAEHRESEQRLKRALEELKDSQQRVIQQERLRALGGMASGIAHDFNNALAAILGFSELLCQRPETLADKEKTLRYLQMMNTAAHDAGNVVNRLREFYRHREDGEVFTPVNLNQVVQQAISFTQPKWKNQAEAKGITIHAVTELGKIPTITGSASDLREALTNLIFNAVDAMPQGGIITLRTHSENSHVILEVADTGMGMTEEVRQRCLEPFFTTKGDHGTGLGLSMVYGILQRHRGTIDIQTTPGRGTTFILSLPVKAESQAATETDSTPRAIRPLRVLLADDQDTVRQILCEYLVGDGHTVTTAANGSEGLEKFQSAEFDVVLLDRAMPGMSGDQVAAAIKQIKPEMPVILLTGFGNMMQASGEKPLGVDLVLAKPVTIAGLQSALASVVASR